VAPASKDYHLAACRQDGGLERFTAMVGAAPVIAPPSTLDRRTADATPGKLTGEELAMCRMMGTDPEKFAAEKVVQAQKATERVALMKQE